MDIEYHFYITYIIALRAGFDKNTAYKIAYSSQYILMTTTKKILSLTEECLMNTKCI